MIALLTIAAAGGTGGSRADLEATLDALPSFGESLLRMTIVLVVILVALVIVVKLLARFGRGRLAVRSTGDIKVVAARQVEPGKRLYIVEVEGRRLLVGCGPTGFDTIADLTSNGAARTNESNDAGERTMTSSTSRRKDAAPGAEGASP